jgi:selenocysteine lyase/cysteine desulfurase
MFNLFSKNKTANLENPKSLQDFSYLDPKAFYFDSACQTLRPQIVIEAETEYYHQFNSCGHRVKYKWGEKVDKLVEECRQNLLRLAGKNSKDYTVAFCLNTTHGINTVLHQINPQKSKIKQIITSEIEHNSVFLPSMVFAQKNGFKRLVLERAKNGELIYQKSQLQNSVVILNTQSNIDGRELLNAQGLAKDTHEMGGILLLDSCQTFGHNPEMLENIDFDAVFGSGHKMYGPSVGFIIIKKDLLKNLDCYLIGGSTVSEVKLDSYELVQNDEEIYARIEPGLQNYAGIVGLNEAIKWRKNFLENSQILSSNHLDKHFLENSQNLETLNKENIQNFNLEQKMAIYLNQKLLEIPKIKLLNPNPSAVVSLYSDNVDGHKMALYLSEIGIMCRSGYHCCHYYLKEKLKLPPLFRISLGLHNTPEQIDFLIEKLKIILK